MFASDLITFVKNVHLKLVFNPGTLKHYYG